MAIIIIIAGIAVPRFLGVTHEGKKARAKSDLNVLKRAAASFFLKNNRVPFSEATVAGELEGADPKIVNNFSVFEDPFSTVEPKAKHRYFADTGQKFFLFLSVGPDGQAGTVAIGSDGTVSGLDSDDVFVTNGKT